MIILILILLGVVFTLSGLVAVGPQVRVHQINPHTKAAWLFKSGAIILISGQLGGLTTSIEPVLGTVSLLLGGAVLFAALAIGSHERQQDNFNFKTSLTLQILGLGVIILLLSLLL